jgi:uncharacterized protein with PIN domain
MTSSGATASDQPARCRGAARSRGFLGRRLECNRPLEEVPRERVEGRVPPHVWATTERFLRCGRCGRLYWPATHRAHMLRELAALGLGPGGPEATA